MSASPALDWASSTEAFEIEDGRGGLIRGVAASRDGWQLLRTPIPNQVPRQRLWTLLEHHSHLSAARFALSRSQSLVLCADVWEPDGLAPPERAEAILEDLRRALMLLAGDTPSADEATPPEVPGVEGWVRLVREAGWPCHPRATGASIDLDAGHGFHQAHLAPAPGGGIRIGVEVARRESASESSRAAIAIMLLTASGVLRMVRPCVHEETGASCLRWEASLPTACDPSELDCALEALSAACRFTAREVAALCDERLAELYLGMRGWPLADSSKEVNR